MAATKQAVVYPNIEDNRYEQDETVVFELYDRKPSANYSITADAASENRGNPMDYCERKLMSQSVMEVYLAKENKWVQRKSRYIAGCETPWIDEQETLGYKPNPNEDFIWVIKGQIAVVNNAAGRAMFNYLTLAYSGNKDVFEKDKLIRRPETHEVAIKAIRTNQEAIDLEPLVDLQYKADQFLQSLKWEDGKKMAYNEDVIQFLAELFKLGHFDTYSGPAWVALTGVAHNDPKKFLDSIASARSLYERDVNHAITLGVIKIEDEAAIFTDGGVIMSFTKTDSKEKKVEILIDFLSNPDNRKFYDQVRVKTQSARSTKAATVLD